MTTVRISEDRHQQSVFEWAFRMRRKYMLSTKHDVSELDLLHAIPNGGQRNKTQAARMTRQGVKRGVFDICHPVGRGGWTSLRIELKAEGGSMTPEQRWWYAVGKAIGQEKVEVCTGNEDAIGVVENYLSLPLTTFRPPEVEAFLDSVTFDPEWNPRIPKRRAAR